MLTCSGCRVGSFCSADHHKMASESIKATLGGNLMLGHPLINTHLPSVSSLVCLGRGVEPDSEPDSMTPRTRPWLHRDARGKLGH
jgi:hypothetical protein